MNFDAMPIPEAKKEDLDGYFENAKRILIDKTLEKIKLAPDNRKGDVLEESFKFYAALDGLVVTLDHPSIVPEAVQKELSKLAQEIGLDPELVSVAKYKELMDQAKKEF